MEKEKVKEEEIEELQGYSIPVRELTVEEANMELTIERFLEYMKYIGEDFLDDRGGGYIPFKIFGGYLLAKEPHLSKEIMEVLNDKYGEMLGLQEVINNYYSADDNDWENPFKVLYGHICDFVNMTKTTKMKVNRQLIQIKEHYS